MTKSTTDELWEELDRSAIKLLKETMGGGALEGEGSDGSVPAAASVNERVRTFQAISAYAKSRTENGPKPKQGTSAFDELRGRFNGTTNGNGSSPKRGTRRAKAPPPDEGGDSEYDA